MNNYLLILLVVLNLSAYAQTTYVWNNAAGGDYNTATNWTPNRNTPATNDILVFNNGASFTVTNVPTQTIGQLKVQNNTQVNFQAAASNNTLTISNLTGTDFLIEVGSQLSLTGTNICTLSVSTGATAEIYGNITASSAAHRFLASSTSSFVFKSGGKAIAQTGFSGSMFGTTGTANTTIFEAGSEYIYQDGGNPFGLAVPNSKVVFQPNSKYIHQHPFNAPGTSGRTYAIFELDHASFNSILAGGSALTVQKFIVKAGNLRLNLTANVNVLEDIVLLAGNSERTSSGQLNVGGNFILNGGNFTYSGTGAFNLLGNLEVQSATSSFLLNPTLTTSRTDIIGGNILNNGNMTFNPAVTPPNYVLSFQNSVSSPQSFTNNGTLIFSPTVAVNLGDADGYELNTDITIQGVLNLPSGGGKINAKGNTLTLGLNNTFPGYLSYSFTSSYLYNGKFRRYFAAGATTSFVSGGFPIGIASDIQPCAVLMTTAPTSGGFITAEYITGYAGTMGLPLVVGAITVNRVYGYGYHRLIPDASLAGYIYTFQMVGTNYYGVGDYQELVLLKRDDSASPWTAPGTQGVPYGSNAQFTLSLIGLTSFSDFIVGGNDVPNPLPVLFRQFTLQRTQHQNYLSWVVDNIREIQNFEIQKSYDLNSFFSLSHLNATHSHVYDFWDNSENSSKVYYRIKANLHSGLTVYSETLELSLQPETKLEVLQNPIQNNLKLLVESDIASSMNAQIIDLKGKKMMEYSYEIVKGKQTFTIDMEDVASGIYILKVSFSSQIYSYKILR